jgi:hypothetical protein
MQANVAHWVASTDTLKKTQTQTALGLESLPDESLETETSQL